MTHKIVGMLALCVTVFFLVAAFAFTPTILSLPLGLIAIGGGTISVILLRPR